MSDGFGFKVIYYCMTCSDCPHFRNGEPYRLHSCDHPKRQGNGKILSTTWVYDEIDPDCPERKTNKINSL